LKNQLSEVLTDAINHSLGSVYTMLPGVVESYDYRLQKAVVRVSINKVIRKGETISPPKIFEVPVVWPHTKNAIIHLPLASGDRVMVVFSCRSLELWLNSRRRQSDPGDFRKFDMSDAVAIPGLFPFSLAADVENGDDLLIQHRRATVRLKANSAIEIHQKLTGSIVKIDAWGNITATTLLSANINATVCTVDCQAATVTTKTASMKAVFVDFSAVTVTGIVLGAFNGAVVGLTSLFLGDNTITVAPGVVDVRTFLFKLHGDLSVDGNITATGTITP